MIYFIADMHLGHPAAVARSSWRFDSVDERDNRIIHNWNQKVHDNDIVYILGDVICKSDKGPEYYLKQLKGKKILVTGNHDNEWIESINASDYFAEVTHYKEIQLGDKTITLCHYPMLEWRNSRKIGSRKLGYLIHGHIHNRTSDMYKLLFEIGNALNAGVDINGYEPVSFDELRMNNERFKLATLSDPVSKALFLCKSYHMHQCDKGGVSYAEHCIRVAKSFNNPLYQIVALLHDTLEDTSLSPALIKNEFGADVYCAVNLLTRKKGEGYFSYIDRILGNQVARAVKIEDLKDNMDLSRLRTITSEDRERTIKYNKALDILMSPQKLQGGKNMNRFKDKYFSILGDSISTFEGYIPNEYPSFYNRQNRYYTGVYAPEETWWGRVINHFGGKLLVNNSWSGSFVCKPPNCEIESYGCSDARAHGLDEDGVTPDHIIIFIGTNDRGAGFPLRSQDKTDLSVIENAYRVMLEKIKRKYPLAEVWCCTFPTTTCTRNPHFRFPSIQCGVPMADYGKLVKEIAEQVSFHIIDFDDDFIGEDCDTIEGLHPNFEGMKYIADKVIAVMEQVNYN